MSTLLIWFAVLTCALAVLIKSADIFTHASGKLAKILGIPDIVIGATLVALGTSLPELAAGMFSVFSETGEFVAGTVIGSNIANIAFIMGTVAVIFGNVSVSSRLFLFDGPVLLLSSFVLGLSAYDGQISFGEGGILFIMYLFYLSHVIKNGGGETIKNGEKPTFVLFIKLILSAFGVYFGAEYTVRAVVHLSELLGFKDTSFMAMTVVAVGSSLPELSVSLAAAKRKMFDMSVGNIIGSNICNTFLIGGLPALIKPLPVTDTVLNIGIPFMLLVTAAFYFFTVPIPLHKKDEKPVNRILGRNAGGFFLLMFIFYIGKLTGGL